jgi:hypothetical protein
MLLNSALRAMKVQTHEGPQLSVPRPTRDPVNNAMTLARPVPAAGAGVRGAMGLAKQALAKPTPNNAGGMWAALGRLKAQKGQPAAPPAAPVQKEAQKTLENPTFQLPHAQPVPQPMPAAPQAPAAPAPTPAIPAAPQAPAPQAPPGASIAPVTGNEVPHTVTPQASGELSTLVSRLDREALRQLDQPTVYDDELFARAKETSARGIRDNYAGARENLDAELASRGINFSSIAGGRHRDLASEEANELSDLDTNLLRERAGILAQGRSAAFGNATRMAGFREGMERGTRDELRGERGYVDNLRREARSDAIQEDQMAETEYQRMLDAALGYGQAPGVSSALQGAGALYGQGASLYGDRASETNDGLAGLAELAMRFFGGSQ